MADLVACGDPRARRAIHDQRMARAGVVNSSVSHSFRLVYMLPPAVSSLRRSIRLGRPLDREHEHLCIRSVLRDDSEIDLSIRASCLIGLRVTEIRKFCGQFGAALLLCPAKGPAVSAVLAHRNPSVLG